MNLRRQTVFLLQQIGTLLKRGTDIIALNLGFLSRRAELIERVIACVMGKDINRYPPPVLFFEPERSVSVLVVPEAAALEVSPFSVSQAAASVASISTASSRQRIFAVFFIKTMYPFLNSFPRAF